MKFYRPERWSDAAIHEEHGFALELAAAEIPVVPPLVRDGRTLFEYEGFRFAVFERRGGRWPELGTRTEREWMGRFLGRIHHGRPAAALSSSRPHRHRAARARSRAITCSTTTGFRRICETAYDSLTADLLERDPRRVRQPRTASREMRLHGDCHRGNVLWTDAGPHFVDLDDCLTGPAIQDLWMLLSGIAQRDGRAARAAAGGLLAVRDVRSRASSC